MTKVVDKAISKTGPVFIAIAVALIDMCVLAYYLVVFPYSHNWSEASAMGRIYIFITLLFTLYMVYCIHFHYYMAIKTNPGSPSDFLPKAVPLDSQPSSSTTPPKETETSLRQLLLDMEESAEFPNTCKKCHLPKPERTHHCSVCNACIMRFDHHCPWIHNCVGHFNHRYFVLFMTYMVLSALYYIVFGWRPFVIALDVANKEWPYYFPRSLMAFSMILAICMGLAIGGLCGWHYYLIITGQTTVEFYDNHYEKSYRKKHNEPFVNMYDFGGKENMKRFFNIGDQYGWITILYPIPIPPRGNGCTFEKCKEFYLLPEARQREQLQIQREVQEIEDVKDI